MDPGNFSVSLNVRDLAASRSFYEALGLQVTGGDEAQGWLVLRSEHAVVGLFQGMFEKNMLTFNPGWDSEAQEIEDFTDIREFATALRAAGLAISGESGLDAPAGPAHFFLTDPDGNPVLIDQHR